MLLYYLPPNDISFHKVTGAQKSSAVTSTTVLEAYSHECISPVTYMLSAHNPGSYAEIHRQLYHRQEE